MAKFVMECPSCGKYVEAGTGVFARRKIDCTCGYTIDVRTDKLTSRECTHCGNTVVFDQSKGDKARCPVCNEPIGNMTAQGKTEEFSCVRCGVRLRGVRGAAVCQCPVCDETNDVAERLASEQARKDGLIRVIQYEGDNETLVWKHPIENFTLGSQLIVHESQEAIFFKDGQALDLFGPGRYTLETQLLPLLGALYQLPAGGQDIFHSEVYFINKTVQMAVKWGTPEPVRIIDPMTGAPLEIGASGELNLRVADARRLVVKLVGTRKGIAWADREGFSKSLQSAFRPLIVSAVKASLPAIIKERQLDLLEIDGSSEALAQGLREQLLPGFGEYGLTIPQLYITNIVLPENDPNFRRIRELHTILLQTKVYQAEATVKTAQAQSETVIAAAQRQAELERQITQTEIARREAERKRIEAQAEAEALRMAGMSEAAVMRAKGYDQSDVLRAEVQKAYAAGLGQMGGSGGGALGDLAGLGVTLGAMGGVLGMTKEAVAPLFGQQTAQVPAGTWDCGCGQRGVSSNFCPNCGTRRPASGTWDCGCGLRGIFSNFCPDCGAMRPAAAWDCTCGEKGISTNFCPNCGKKKGD